MAWTVSLIGAVTPSDVAWQRLQEKMDLRAASVAAGVVSLTPLDAAKWLERQRQLNIEHVAEFLREYPRDPRRWDAVLQLAAVSPTFALSYELHANGRNVLPSTRDEVAMVKWGSQRTAWLQALILSADATELQRGRAEFHLIVTQARILAEVPEPALESELLKLRKRHDDAVRRFGHLINIGAMPHNDAYLSYTYALHQSVGARGRSDLRLAELEHLAQSGHPVIAALASCDLVARDAIPATLTQPEAFKALLARFGELLSRHGGVIDPTKGEPLLRGQTELLLKAIEVRSPDQVRAFFDVMQESSLPAYRDFATRRLEQIRRKESLFAKQVELSFTAVDGRVVDLRSLRGKVVLIDFWATWCGPCIAELPNIKKVYTDYHARGFEIVGIALENARLAPTDTAEQAAIKHAQAKQVLTDFTAKHELTWPHYYDGKFWKNDLAVRYGIQSIPAMFLLDREGRLVSTDARGEKLEAEVKRLLGL